MKFEPHPYQKDLIKLGVSQGAAGFLVDPGMGKTACMFAVYHILKSKNFVRAALVIAPLRVAHSVWPKERLKWDEFHDLKVVVLHGPEKDRLLSEPADIYVINPDGLEWLAKRLAGKTMPFDMLVVDESTQFKHSNTKRFKLLKNLLNFFTRRYILTGSPTPNGLLDLFGQIYILDQGAALGRFITHYRNKFFDATGFGGYTWVARAGAKEQIYDRIAPLTIRLSASDHLSLPPLLYNNVEVELPPAAMQTYLAMENLMLAEVAGDFVTAANAAAATIKCRQIANGGIYTGGNSDGGERSFENIHDAKIEAVKSLVEELSGKPAFIAYEFKHDLARLRAAFPEARVLGGGVSAAEAADTEALWNDGKLPVLLAQPQSVAHGLNLQGTQAAVIWHSLTWNLEHYEQFIRRIWRQGQEGSVMVHHIIAKDTVDELMLKTIHKKDGVQQDLLTALKAYVRRRLS